MDGYVYRLDYTERQYTEEGTVLLNAKAVEYSATDEDAVRDRIAALQGEGGVESVTLKRRLPTPEWEDVAL